MVFSVRTFELMNCLLD